MSADPAFFKEGGAVEKEAIERRPSWQGQAPR